MVLKFKERKIIERIKAETDNKHGCIPEERSVEELLDLGVVNLNKPQGPTSHQIADSVKNVLGVKKCGHSGTLDPNVRGVLVVALGRGTRAVDVLLKSGKEYVCLMKLHESVEENKLREVIGKFVGEIEQLPPKKSAVKRQWRFREIYYIDILEINGQEVLFRVGCQAGTYIRKLCTDIGKELGIKAHMQELVRTKVAHFEDNDWVSLHDLKDAYVKWKEEKNEEEIRKCVKPIEIIVEHMPKIWVQDSAVDSLCHGAYLSVPGVVKLNEDINVGDKVAVMTLKNELIGFGDAKMNVQNLLHNEKGLVVGNLKIFMKRGTYPKYKKDEES